MYEVKKSTMTYGTSVYEVTITSTPRAIWSSTEPYQDPGTGIYNSLYRHCFQLYKSSVWIVRLTINIHKSIYWRTRMRIDVSCGLWVPAEKVYSGQRVN